MKILVVCLLGCAMMVLARAAAVQGPKDKSDEIVSTDLVMKPGSCSRDWTEINGRGFHYVPKIMTWAEAERYCQSMDGNLASVHSLHEYHDIKRLILSVTHDSKQAWIGASNAQQDTVWLWSDGSGFHYSDWCKGEPNNGGGAQRCLQINHSDRKCWDDVACEHQLPFVCAKKA